MFLIKLGGSVITDKGKKYAFKKDVMDRLSSEITKAGKEIILIHGAGSFGHILAKQHSLNQGYKNNTQLQGFSDTHAMVQQLNSLVLASLHDHDIAAVSIPPHAILQLDDHKPSKIHAMIGLRQYGFQIRPGGESNANKKLVMHVRRCDETQLQVPFHVGDDASRTWLITKTGSGLSLKHDHRHRDGTQDALTQYGGHTVDAGWAQVQSFPADQYSKELFVDNAIPQSVGNTWQMYIYPERFTYRLIRQGREFRVDFDLTTPIDAPPAPWGYDDTEL